LFQYSIGDFWTLKPKGKGCLRQRRYKFCSSDCAAGADRVRRPNDEVASVYLAVSAHRFPPPVPNLHFTASDTLLKLRARGRQSSQRSSLVLIYLAVHGSALGREIGVKKAALQKKDG
jgi:hypothetical protein